MRFRRKLLMVVAMGLVLLNQFSFVKFASAADAWTDGNPLTAESSTDASIEVGGSKCGQQHLYID